MGIGQITAAVIIGFIVCFTVFSHFFQKQSTNVQYVWQEKSQTDEYYITYHICSHRHLKT